MKDSLLSVKNKVILVSGAFGLIGSEISKCFLENQAKVVLAGHNKSRVDFIKTEIAQTYSSDQFLVCDLEITNEDSINGCIEKVVSKFGKIDTLINNAAIDAKFDDKHHNKFSTRFDEYPVELIKRSVDVNIIGTVQVTQTVCRQMLKQTNGNIINVGSIYSMVAPHQEIYSDSTSKQKFKPVDYIISKSYIPNFTRYLATLYAKNNIRCNAIAPGGIYNDHDKTFVEKYSKYCPTERMIDKSDIGGPFIFLAADASKAITGVTLLVDDGWTAW